MIIQNVFTIAKVISSSWTQAAAGFSVRAKPIRHHAANFHDFWHTAQHFSWSAVALVGTAMVGPLFASDAWNNITFTRRRSTQSKARSPVIARHGSRSPVSALYIAACNFRLSVGS